jgi:hypothetical protein
VYQAPEVKHLEDAVAAVREHLLPAMEKQVPKMPAGDKESEQEAESEDAE